MSENLSSKMTDYQLQNLKEEYDFECAKCGHGMSFAPSIIMEMGINKGQGQCSKCSTFLKLRIADDNEKGESQISQEHYREKNNDRES